MNSSGRPGAGSIVIESIESPLLAGNPLGDPHTRRVPVYVPPSYYDSNTTYAVVYCLTGFTGAARSWFNFQAWTPSIDERLDQLIAGGMPEIIAVFPDCFTRYGGSQYLDSIAVGAYQSHIAREIVPHIDSKFRTRPDRKHRGILGKSSGGYGALMMGIDHPQIFSAVGSHSGDMYFEYAYLPEFPVAARGLEKAGGLANFLKTFGRAPLSGREDHAVANIVAMSACYSPNASAIPHLFDLPFREDTAELIPEVWQRWLEKDPLRRLRSGNHGLKEAGLLYLDCGKRDEFFLNFGARLFSRELHKQGINHVYEEFDGGHSNVQFRYDISLRLFADYLA